MIMEPNSLFSIIIRSFEPLSSLLLRSPLSSLLCPLSSLLCPLSFFLSLFSLLSSLVSPLPSSTQPEGVRAGQPPARVRALGCKDRTNTVGLKEEPPVHRPQHPNTRTPNPPRRLGLTHPTGWLRLATARPEGLTVRHPPSTRNSFAKASFRTPSRSPTKDCHTTPARFIG